MHQPERHSSSGSEASPREAAAYWFMRMTSGNSSPSERSRFQEWYAADPEHAARYDEISMLWQAAGRAPAEQWARMGHGEAAGIGRPPPSPVRRRLAQGLAAGLLAGGAGWMLYQNLFSAPAFQQTLATRRGERRDDVLPDGSSVVLNTATQLDIRYDSRRRTLDLVQGEIFVEVTPDAAREFVVRAGALSVTVTGTAFGVRRDAAGWQVAVRHGSVQVEDGPWWRRQRISLAGRQAAALRADGHVERREGDRAVQNLAWISGQLVFDDLPLPGAIADLNRYLPQPVRVDETAARLRVSGVFSLQDPQSLLRVLPRILPVEIRADAQGRQVITAR